MPVAQAAALPAARSTSVSPDALIRTLMPRFVSSSPSPPELRSIVIASAGDARADTEAAAGAGVCEGPLGGIPDGGVGQSEDVICVDDEGSYAVLDQPVRARARGRGERSGYRGDGTAE